MLSMQRWKEILLEVGNGAPAPKNESKEEAIVRRRLTKQVAAIHEKGGFVDVPADGG